MAAVRGARRRADGGREHDLVDPFDISVRRVAQDAAGQARDAAYLHPVVRHHRDGQVVAAHHLAENLENQWNRLRWSRS